MIVVHKFLSLSLYISLDEDRTEERRRERPRVRAITLPRHIRRRSFHYPPKWRMKCPPILPHLSPLSH